MTGILFVLKSGLPWEGLPQEMGCGMSWRRKLNARRRVGVWERMYRFLLERDAGKID